VIAGLERLFPAAIRAYLEFTRAGYPHFDLIAFLQSHCIDHSGRQTDGETVSPP